MAKVVFSLTDAQVELLARLHRGEPLRYFEDPRTLTGLEKRGLIVNGEPGAYRSQSWTLSPAGKSAIALCERLAILPANSERQ